MKWQKWPRKTSIDVCTLGNTVLGPKQTNACGIHPRSRRNNLIPKNRLAYNLAFIEALVRKWEKTGWSGTGWTKTKAKARQARENVHNGEPEIRANAPCGASSATRHAEILSSRQLYDTRKRDDGERRNRGKKMKSNWWDRRFRRISVVKSCTTFTH